VIEEPEDTLTVTEIVGVTDCVGEFEADNDTDGDAVTVEELELPADGVLVRLAVPLLERDGEDDCDKPTVARTESGRCERTSRRTNRIDDVFQEHAVRPAGNGRLRSHSLKLLKNDRLA
jgi:hypothetical protein